MTDIHDRLRDADPVLTEPGLTAEDAAAIRRRVIDAARQPHPAVVEWKRTLALAATVALIAGLGIDSARRTPRQGERQTPVTAAPPPAGTTRTQLHFSTPGGTRIIWTLDPGFQLTEKR